MQKFLQLHLSRNEKLWRRRRSGVAVAIMCMLLLAVTACAAAPTAATPAPTPAPAVPTFTPVITPAEVAPGGPLSTTGNVTTTDVAAVTDVMTVTTSALEASPVVTSADPVTTAPGTTAPATDQTAATTTTTQTVQESAAVTQPVLPAIEQPVEALVVGVNAEFDPFEYRDEAGQLAGFDIDLINALAQASNIEVSFVDMDFNALIPAVVDGEVDLAISAMTPTEERAELVAFTDPYFSTDQSPVSYFSGGQGLAVRSDTTMIQTAADLTPGIKVGVKSGTTGDFYVVENTDAEIVRFDESPTALMALANGDVKAVVTDIAVIAEFVTDHPDLNVQLMGTPLTVESYAIAVSKERPDLLQIFNAALTKIRDDGTYDTLVEKWFQVP